jgi:uncharacterized protein (DUF2236 family)
LLLRAGGWAALRPPIARVIGLATIGLLPPALRRRFDVELTRAQELQLRALAASLRAATPLMPSWLRNTGPGYLRWRREALAPNGAEPPL